MEKAFLLFSLLLLATVQHVTSYSEVKERIEQLKACTAARKRSKLLLQWEKWTFIPVGFIVGALTQDNKGVGFCAGAGTIGLIYCITAAIRAGQTYLAQYYFHKLYNKRVDAYGNSVSPFSPEARYYQYALDDLQFISFGRAAGYSTQELIRLANKHGRTEVAARLAHGEQFAHTV